MMEAEFEVFGGDYQRAQESLAAGRAVLAESAETGFLATVAGYQAHLCFLLGRDDEALQHADEADAMGQADDFEPHARARLVRAHVFAKRGDFTAADEQIAAAAELIEPIDYVILHLDLAFARADVARAAGRPGEARKALEQAIEVGEAKGHALAVERARNAIAALD
jgi:tetratricopeptide (TPR) repeat protein